MNYTKNASEEKALEFGMEDWQAAEKAADTYGTGSTQQKLHANHARGWVVRFLSFLIV